MLSTDIPQPFPFARDARCPFEPPREVREPGQEPKQVTIWNGRTAWLVTRHSQVQAILSDPRASHDIGNPGYPHESEPFMTRARLAPSFQVMDDPEHARIRRMANPAFMAKRVAALRDVLPGRPVPGTNFLWEINGTDGDLRRARPGPRALGACRPGVLRRVHHPGRHPRARTGQRVSADRRRPH